MVSENWTKTNRGPNKVLLVTSKGNITIEPYDNMPITSGNFRNLAERRIFDGTIFTE
jgi:cyclophilin family peptidyl-prolyl cis-trans isomerase